MTGALPRLVMLLPRTGEVTSHVQKLGARTGDRHADWSGFGQDVSRGGDPHLLPGSHQLAGMRFAGIALLHLRLHKQVPVREARVAFRDCVERQIGAQRRLPLDVLERFAARNL